MKTLQLSLIILTLFNLFNLLVWAQPVRERPAGRPTQVDVTGLTLAQAKAARQAQWRLRNAQAKQAHRAQLRADLQADRTRENRPFPGRRGGIRCRLIWPDTAAFEAWEADYDGLPRIENRFALNIGTPAYEFPGDDVTPPSGRRYCEIQVTIPEIHWLEIHDVLVARAGSWDAIDLEPQTP